MSEDVRESLSRHITQIGNRIYIEMFLDKFARALLTIQQESTKLPNKDITDKSSTQTILQTAINQFPDNFGGFRDAMNRTRE